MKSIYTIPISLLFFSIPTTFGAPFTSEVTTSTVQGRDAAAPAPIKEKAPWYLARISAPNGDTSVYSLIEDGPYYHDPRSGAGVDAYLIDGNIYPGHPDFGGRLSMMGEGAVTRDRAGHGTEVAGIMGGSRFGVARKVNILACDITVYGIPGCLRKIIERHTQAMAGPGFVGSVINISRGSPKSKWSSSDVQDQYEAVRDAVDAGIHVVVSAGNHNKDACDYAPAGLQERIPEMIVVGATGKKELTGDKNAPGVNEISGYSNTGRCVDIYAPGSAINAPGINDGYLDSVSGTSAAAPLVAGVIAELMVRRSELRNDPRKMKDFLLGKNNGPNAGRKGAIKDHAELDFLYNGIHES
ncbi:Cerevisin [Dactylellina cionopaga]|nr:Cerevisin [Dactylellina cionopaga]